MDQIEPVGYGINLTAEAIKILPGAKLSVFDYSPGFYIAGTNSNTLFNDREGFSFSKAYKYQDFSANTCCSYYKSNLDNRYPGGEIGFDEYSGSIGFPIKYLGHLSYRGDLKEGSNSDGNIKNSVQELSLERPLYKSLNLKLAYNSNIFDSNVNTKAITGYNSKYEQISQSLNFKLPFKAGYATIENDITKMDINNSINNYTLMKLSYNFPTFFSLSPSFSVGYTYLGLQNNLDFGFGLSYISKSGRKISATYSYMKQPGVLFDGVLIPTTTNNYFYVTVSDAYSLAGNNFQSVGSYKGDQGYIKVMTFIDKNNNGILDKNEKLVSDIPLLINGINSTVYTKKGKYVSPGLKPGFYKIRINQDELPGILSIASEKSSMAIVKVEKNKTTQIMLPLISTPGLVSGKIRITDEFGREQPVDDVVISIFDESGKEVKYTTANDDGTYHIAGLSPGKYIVKIDDQFLESAELTRTPTSEVKVEIPEGYKDYAEIKDINLEYKH